MCHNGRCGNHGHKPCDKTIRVRASSSLCFNAWGGRLRQGDAIKLYPCSAARNEQFDFHGDGTIRLSANPSLCLNAWGGGLKQGDAIKLYKCSAARNEVFTLGGDGTLRVKANPALCMNAWGGHLRKGDAIKLYKCSAARNEVWNACGASRRKPNGAPCATGSQCRSNLCLNGKCHPHGGHPCTSHKDCPGGTCKIAKVTGDCKRTTWMTCGADTSCRSKGCTGKCVCDKSGWVNTCTCRPSGGTCVPVGLPDGSPCKSNGQCQSKVCHSGRCGNPHKPCSSNKQCPGGGTCLMPKVTGDCKRTTWGTCGRDDQCSSRKCTGKCVCDKKGWVNTCTCKPSSGVCHYPSPPHCDKPLHTCTCYGNAVPVTQFPPSGWKCHSPCRRSPAADDVFDFCAHLQTLLGAGGWMSKDTRQKLAKRMHKGSPWGGAGAGKPAKLHLPMSSPAAAPKEDKI